MFLSCPVVPMSYPCGRIRSCANVDSISVHEAGKTDTAAGASDECVNSLQFCNYDWEGHSEAKQWHIKFRRV